jgi:hypothetical protein
VGAISAASSFGGATAYQSTTSAVAIELRIKSSVNTAGKTSGTIHISFISGVQGGSLGKCIMGFVTPDPTSTNLSSIQFIASTGNIDVGSEFYVYGVKK